MEDEVLAHLKVGPKTADELVKLVEVSRKTLYKRMRDLAEAKKVLLFPLYSNGHWVSLYALPHHRDLAVAISGYIPADRGVHGLETRLGGALEVLRLKLCRNPDVDELALELGENPEDKSVRDAIYRVASRMNWRPPAPEERKRGDRERELVLQLAMWLRKGHLENLKGRPEPMVKKARAYLERFPDAVPNL
ncbi:MAG: hypothetical protein QXO51_00490 [Halobacteria archaeon]